MIKHCLTFGFSSLAGFEKYTDSKVPSFKKFYDRSVHVYSIVWGTELDKGGLYDTNRDERTPGIRQQQKMYDRGIRYSWDNDLLI